MSLESELVARLQVAVPSTQVHQVRRPEGVRHSVIVLARLSNLPHSEITGTARLHDARYTVSVYSPSLDAGRAVRDAVITALHGYAGGLIKACAHETDFEIHDERESEFHFPIDFTVTY